MLPPISMTRMPSFAEHLNPRGPLAVTQEPWLHPQSPAS